MPSEHNDNRSRWIKTLLLSLAITIALNSIGAGFAKYIPYAETVALAAFFCLLALIALNPLMAKLYMKKLNDEKTEDLQQRIRDAQRSAESDLDLSIRKMNRSLIKVRIYCVFCFLLIAATQIGAGASYHYTGRTGFMLIGLYLICGLISKLMSFSGNPTEPSQVKRDRFPKLYKIVDEIFGAVGISGVELDASGSASVAVSQDGDRINVEIGAISAALLKKEELKQVLIHERAHVLHGDTKLSLSAYRLISRITSTSSQPLTAVSDLLIRYPATRIMVAYKLYLAATSRLVEVKADEYTKKHGAGLEYINATAKVNMLGLFSRHEYKAMFYENERPPEHYYGDIVDAFLKALPTREGFWRGIVERELPARVASHPTFRQRWEHMGSPEYTLDFSEPDEDYIAEINDYVALCDGLLYESIGDRYPDLRKENYLKPLEAIEEYNALLNQGKPVPFRELRPVIDAYGDLSRYDDMMTLCDYVISHAEHKFMAAHAHFKKGMRLLQLYDKAGIEELYKAIDTNSNYVEDGYDAIGNFCLEMGLEEELEEYRRRSLEVSKNYWFIEDSSQLNARDRLSFDDRLTEERRERDTDFIKKTCGEILKVVYQVKKEIKEGYFVSVFIVGFDRCADEAEIDNCMQKIFRYLDTVPEDWQYSLFRLDDSIEKYVKRVPGSKIYERAG